MLKLWNLIVFCNNALSADADETAIAYAIPASRSIFCIMKLKTYSGNANVVFSIPWLWIRQVSSDRIRTTKKQKIESLFYHLRTCIDQRIFDFFIPCAAKTRENYEKFWFRARSPLRSQYENIYDVKNPFWLTANISDVHFYNVK